jgi:hypothetical protein
LATRYLKTANTRDKKIKAKFYGKMSVLFFIIRALKKIVDIRTVISKYEFRFFFRNIFNRTKNFQLHGTVLDNIITARFPVEEVDLNSPLTVCCCCAPETPPRPLGK